MLGVDATHKIDCQVRKSKLTKLAKELNVYLGLGRYDLRKMPNFVRVLFLDRLVTL